jgi:hypothetical protein
MKAPRPPAADRPGVDVLPAPRRRLAAAGPTLAAAAAAMAMLAVGPKAAPRPEEESRRPDRLGNAVREATTRGGPRAAERPRAAAPQRPARAPPPTRARAFASEIVDLFVSFYPRAATRTLHAPKAPLASHSRGAWACARAHIHHNTHRDHQITRNIKTRVASHGFTAATTRPRAAALA